MDISKKNVYFLGDSITEGVGASCIEEKCYVSLFKARYPEANIQNYGVGGTRIARKKQTPSEYPVWDDDFNMRADRMDENADLVVIFGGTNDYGHGDAVLGKFGDKDVYTFYGATYTLFEKLLTKYPNAKFLVLTPLHRLGEIVPNALGNVLQDYRKALLETAEYFSFPVLDLFATSGMNPQVAKVQETMMPDGLHPNDAGYQRLFELIDQAIKYTL